MGNHRALTGLNIHTPITWTYADSTARLSASGFTAIDLYKFSRQEDDNSLWMLVATTPTWVELGVSANVMLKSTYDTDDDGIVDGAEILTDGVSGNEVTYAEAQDAVNKAHNQNTDTGTNNNSFSIGDGTTGSNKEITADNGDVNEPKIRYNESTNTWQLTNDGTNWNDIEAGIGSGDMLKSTYDTDNNGIVDKAEELNDGSSGGGNAVTALEARAHIDDLDIHRTINDSGSGVADLWSANKITSEFTANAPTKEVFFNGNYGSNFGDYRTRSIGATGTYRFNFFTPHDFTSIVSLTLVYIAVSSSVSGTVDLFSDYGVIGENYANHSETVVGLTPTRVAGQKDEQDISGVFSALSAGDYCGLLWDNNSVGSTIHILGIRLRYT